MVLRGHVENGAVVVDDSVPLPEGAEVRIEVLAQQPSFWECQSLYDLAEQQGVRPIDEVDELTDLWPADDDANELLRYILQERMQRRKVAGEDHAQ